MAANAFRTNPEGGGGDQFMHLYVVTQGEFGMHRTMSGKIVYRKPRKFFDAQSIARILPKVAAEEEKLLDEDFTWWQKLINWAAEYMLNKIASILNLNEGPTRIFWAWINATYINFLRKVIGDNGFSQRTAQAYQNRLETALNEYLRDPSGKYSKDLLEKLLEDLGG